MARWRVPGGVSQRGGAPGTRETDLLESAQHGGQGQRDRAGRRQRVRPRCGDRHGRWLEEHNIGWDGASRRCRSSRPRSCSTWRRRKPEDPSDAPTAATRPPRRRRPRRCTKATIGAGAGATVGKIGGPGRVDEGGHRQLRRIAHAERPRRRAPSSRSTPSATSSIPRPARSSPACATRTAPSPTRARCSRSGR